MSENDQPQARGISLSTFGRAAAVVLAAPSYADDDFESAQTFSRLLDGGGVLFKFNLEKREGQSYCESVIDGQSPLDATEDLARDGAYSFDVANGITSAAMVAYCECSVSAAEGVPVSGSLCRPLELDYRRNT